MTYLQYMLLFLLWKQKLLERESRFNSVVGIHDNSCTTYTNVKGFLYLPMMHLVLTAVRNEVLALMNCRSHTPSCGK